MPSFRAGVAVVEMRAGVAPEAALDAARLGARARAHVEDAFVDVLPLSRGSGPPRVVVRFVVEHSNDRAEDAEAWAVARALAAAVGRVAAWDDLRVHRRWKGRWVRLDGAQPHDGQA